MRTLLPRDLHAPFMRQRRVAFALSLLLVLVSFAALATRGLPLGLDFTGGYAVEVAFEEAPGIDPVRTALDEAGLPDAVVQAFGSSSQLLVRLPPESADAAAEDPGEHVLAALESLPGGAPELLRTERVGPQIGEELRETGGLAILAALIGIFAYVSVRYERRFSASAVLAVVHDVLIVLGAFSLFRIEFDLTVLAAVLAVIGYSINDTIVIFDRIRDELRRNRGGDVADAMDRAISDTLSRTLLTSLLTLLSVVSMLVIGGEVLRGFALALTIGIVVGTYSSIYVASAVALSLGFDRTSLLPPASNADDDRP